MSVEATPECLPNAIAYRNGVVGLLGDHCALCDTTGSRLEIHHIDRNRDNNTLSNLELLCRKCHNKATRTPPTTTGYRRILVRLLGSQCSKCGGTESPEVHHIDGNPNNNDSNNLRLLCEQCDRQTQTVVSPKRPPKKSGRRAVFADLIPHGCVVSPGSSSVVQQVLKPVSREFAKQVAIDPDVQDWLISCSERDATRGEYLGCLVLFLQWAEWTPNRIFEIKREALRRGEPRSEVETQIKRFHEALRQAGYAGMSRAKMLAAVYSFIGSKGYPIPRKLVRFDSSPVLQMRVPTTEEVELFIQYAHSLEKKLLYTLMTEIPSRPRVFPALRWSWLEANWWEKDYVHITLPKEFRPGSHGGPRKFEPICFIGPKTINMLKQYRDADLRAGRIPKETDQILTLTYEAMLIAVRRDYEELVTLGLVKASRKDEKDNSVEQPITPKSWRKYQFNIIDALTDVSPEWRKMLKGRDLQTERYYSKENIEELRKIYRTKIYPRLWLENQTAKGQEEIRSLHERLRSLEKQVADYKQVFEELRLGRLVLRQAKTQ